jgi:hypothetical protein
MDDCKPRAEQAESNALEQLIEKLRSIRVKLPHGLRPDIAEELDAMIASLEDELGSVLED